MATSAQRPPANGRRYASVREAAEYTGLCTRTIRRYIAAGRITGHRLGPKLIQVDLNEVDRLVLPLSPEVTDA
jgi:excisionase family DNA binding protein